MKVGKTIVIYTSIFNTLASSLRIIHLEISFPFLLSSNVQQDEVYKRVLITRIECDYSRLWRRHVCVKITPHACRQNIEVRIASSKP